MFQSQKEKAELQEFLKKLNEELENIDWRYKNKKTFISLFR
jgi:hypothetical protein